MTETILVNVTPRETRVAVLANDALQDIYIERSASRGIVGNIYLGKVARVLPGMQAAFINFGTDSNGFIPASDLAGQPGARASRGSRAEPAIAGRLHDGQKLLVQVTREPLGSKGARLSTELALSARLLVFQPRATRSSVSQRIADPAERTRLQNLLAAGRAAEMLAAEGGYILRTAAEGCSLAEIQADLRYLQRLWAELQRRAREATRPQLLYEDLPLHLRIARDLASPAVARVLVDCRDSLDALRTFCRACVPELVDRLEHYTGDTPLFDLHSVEAGIQAALARRVELDCGGYLVIDQTEALATIDVNTGAFVGRGDLEETVYQTNLEAVAVIARQLRLRNLGGIIILDLIDMQDPAHRRQVQLALQSALERDPVPVTVGPMSPLGLVEITRKRSRDNLQHSLCEPCPCCQGRGAVKTAQTVCLEIFREACRIGGAVGKSELLVLASRPVGELLTGAESALLVELQTQTGKSIQLRVEPDYSQEHFDIVLR